MCVCGGGSVLCVCLCVWGGISVLCVCVCVCVCAVHALRLFI